MSDQDLSKSILPDFFSTFFIFPFVILPKDKLNVSDIMFKSDKWEYKPYEMVHGIDYNEYMYFYPYIWNILFNSSQIKNKADLNNSVSFFQYKLTKQSNWFKVTYTNDDKNKIQLNYETITLPIKNIFLHIFNEIGVGVLIYEIVDNVEKTRNKYNLQEYLFFLAMGRRIYPPFVRSDINIETNEVDLFKKLNTNSDKNNNKFNECGIRKSDGSIYCNEFSDCIEIIINGKKIKGYDKNIKLTVQENKQYKPKLSNIVTQILDAENFIYKDGDYYPIIDDRMFTHTFFSIPHDYNKKLKGILCRNGHFISNLKNFFRVRDNSNKINDTVNLWYKMIFIDWVEPSCQNPIMKQSMVFDSTYERWSDWGTFYGFSRYSSVTISDIDKAGYIYNHFQTMYYQVAVLLSFYRGALLNFSNQSEEMAKEMNRMKKPYDKKLLIQIRELHRKFILFRNKYWFREVTAQDQGIEMFDLWSRKMRNSELLQDVKDEIKELYIYVDSMVEKETGKRLHIITKIGVIFIPLSLATSFFGMNLYYLIKEHKWLINFIKKFISVSDIWTDVIAFGFVTFVCFVLFFIIYHIYKLKK